MKPLDYVLPITLCLAACNPAGSTEWWEVTDTSQSPSGEEGEDWDEDDDDDDDDEGDDEEDFGQVFWGEVERSAGEGGVGYFHSTAQDGVLCDLEYSLRSVSERSACDGCELALELSLGEAEVYEEQGDGCSGSPWSQLADGTLGVGVQGEALQLDLGSGWESVPQGFAEMEGQDLFFEVGGWEE